MTTVTVTVSKNAGPIDVKRASAELRSAMSAEKIAWTPEWNQQWADTVSFLSWRAPGFRHLFYKLLSNTKDGRPVLSRLVDVAATDGKNVIVNPDVYFAMKLKQRAFVGAHEIMHNVFNDVNMLHQCAASGEVPQNDGTKLPFRPHLMQKAADLRINDTLIESNIGVMPTVYTKDGKERQCGLWDKSVATCADSVFDIYKKLFEDEEANGPGKLPDGFDVVLAPGTSTGQDPTTAAADRNPQQWAMEISVAHTLEQMRNQGKMAGALQRMFQEILEPKVPWAEHLRTIFARKVGQGGYNWRKGDRRFIAQDVFLPSRSGAQAGWIAVWGDVSGSISEAEMCKYLAELAGIIEDANPRRLTVYWCDDAVQRVDELQDFSDLENIKHVGITGGGGTSVDPVFAAIAEELETPEVFIGFTDGYVTFPARAPSYHVIWASISDHTYPWGDVVRINN
jgi:Schitoviridae HNH endonuclease